MNSAQLKHLYLKIDSREVETTIQWLDGNKLMAQRNDLCYSKQAKGFATIQCVGEVIELRGSHASSSKFSCSKTYV